MRYLRFPMFLVALMGLTMVTAVDSAQAGKIYDVRDQVTGFWNAQTDGKFIDTKGGRTSTLAGASSFGDSVTGPVCPLCDSTVNFTAYANPDGRNWVTDLGLPAVGVGVDSPGMMAGIDETAKWVFFYQIENTNPLGVVNAPLENFNVTKEWIDGSPVNKQPYTSAGYIDDWDIDPFDANAPLDVPNDWIPGVEDGQLIAIGNDDIEPTGAFGTDLNGPSPIATPSVRNGSVAYSGALFQFEPVTTNGIPANEQSELLFLTSNDPYAGFVWAETESPGGFGAAGDVVGIKNVPEPSSMAIWSLIGFAGMARFRRRKN